jgi:hypothetical protein
MVGRRQPQIRNFTDYPALVEIDFQRFAHQAHKLADTQRNPARRRFELKFKLPSHRLAN